MPVTEKKFFGEECKNTGNLWTRMCQNCNHMITYKNKRCLLKSIREGKYCKSCSLRGRKMPIMTEEHKYKIRCSHKKNGVGLWMAGRKLSDETRKKISISNRGRVVTDETRKRYSTSKMGDKNPSKRMDVRRKISETQRNNPRIISEETRHKHSIRAKENIIKQLERMGGLHRPLFNPNACKYFNSLNETFGWKLRHAMNGGEKRILCYFLDAFDEARNIVIEYDEPHHYTWDGKLRPYDIIRMNDVISHLGCTFMRYNEKTGELKSYGKNYEIISD